LDRSAFQVPASRMLAPPLQVVTGGGLEASISTALPWTLRDLL
jgi:hypothetical protein